MWIYFSQSYLNFEKQIPIGTLALDIHKRKGGTRTRDLKEKIGLFISESIFV